MALVAVDLRSSGLTSAVIGMSGKILQRETSGIANLQGKKVSDLIQNQITKLLGNFELKPLQLRSVGISVPGIYFSKSGTVWSPNIPGWESYPLKHDMSCFMEQNIRIKIASNRTCDILGEKWLGEAKRTKNAIYLSIGNGIGAGILVDGKILHGFDDGAGAVGWLTMESKISKEYSQNGFFEFQASAKGILNSLKKVLQKNKDYTGSLRNKSEEELSITDVFIAYDKDDQIARTVLKNCIKYWGMASANLISLFNPEIIIFGGSVFGPAKRFLDEIKAEAEKWAQPIFMKQVKFVKSKLGSDAALFGAGHLAMKRY